MLQTTKSIIFVATCDEVEYFSFLFESIRFKDANGIALPDESVLS